MKSKILGLVATGLLAGPITVGAVDVQSSTSAYMTGRSCVAGTTVCDAISPVLVSAIDGSPGDVSATANLSDAAYGSATGSAQLTGTDGAASHTGNATSLAGTRTNSTTHALQRYTYAGASAAMLTFSGTLRFDQTVPAENAGFDPNNAAAVYSGAFAALEIFTLSGSSLDAGVTDYDNFLALYGGYTGAPGYASLGFADTVGSSNVTGSGTINISISALVNPGDSIWLWSALQTPAVNGAMVDASFVTSTRVPEPGTLALLGLGLAGLGLSRRRRAN